jgi:hypothetical protein
MATTAHGPYFRKWLKTAFGQSIGPIDLYSGLGAAAVTGIAHFLPAWEGELNNLVWQIPLWVAAAVVGVRLALAPYWIWRSQTEKIEALKLRLKNVEDEYAHAFTLDGINLEDYRRKDEATGAVVAREHQFVLLLRNAINRPISYTVRKLVVDRQQPTNFQNRGGVVAASTTTSFYSPTCPALLAMMDKHEHFELEFEIEYGSPDKSVVRLLTCAMSLDSYPGAPAGRTKMLFRDKIDVLLKGT